MASVACYTSFSYAYLPRALVLADSLRRVHPDWVLYALVTDKAPPALPDGVMRAFDRVVDAEELAIPGFRAWLFKHDLVEACTAVKGAMLLRLLGEGADKVIYLDPDIAVFAPLDPVLTRLDRASVVLTPHQTAPNDAAPAIADNELTSLRLGVYNLGFLGVRNDAAGRGFAGWWADRLYEACYDDPAAGLFTDQKYCDLVPGLFDGVHVERDPGCNVASWNINRRRLAVTPGGDLLAGGHLLRFYHFTKIDSVGERMTERYASDNIEVYELLAWYRRALARFALAGLEAHAWHYGRFSDGTAIPRAARLLLRARADLRAGFADPFAAPGGYLAWLRKERPEILGIEASPVSG